MDFIYLFLGLPVIVDLFVNLINAFNLDLWERV